jgi:phospholipid N-methyltransferase
MENYGKSLNWENINLIKKIPSIEYKYILKNYSFLLNLDKNVKILEIWPWIWYFTQFLINNDFKNIDIVEISEDFYTAQKKSFREYNLNYYNDNIINFFQNNDYKYDIIISRQVVEHLEDKELHSFFENWMKHLNKNWLLISETINSQNFIYSSFLRYIDITHKISFSSDMIKQLFNLYWSINDELCILWVKQLNTLDYIIDKISPIKCDIKLYFWKDDIFTWKKSNIFLNIINIFSSFFNLLIRDLARFASEIISKFFFYKRAYKNIWSEFILFIFEKWKK